MRLSLFIFFISLRFFAQDFTAIKEKTTTYRGHITAEKLAKKIASDFSSDEDKVKAIFCWLTENIRYDLDEFYNPKHKTTNFRYRTLEEKEQILQAIKDKRVTKTLNSRKAVCEGYAQTFAKVCNLLAIENEVIKGYARGSFNDIGNPISQANHAWNAVKINNQWMYIDATWGAGHQNNGKWHRVFKPYFFDMKKETYFKTHLPEDSLWKLRVGRMDIDTFYNQPIYSDSFLTSTYTLEKPFDGFLKRDENGLVSVTMQNLDANSKVHFGFIGEQYAKKATIENLNGSTTASVLAPKNAQLAFFLIDMEVLLTFKIL